LKPRTAEVTGWALAALSVLLGVLTVVLWSSEPGTLPWMLMVLLAVIPPTFAFMGGLIISRRPHNRIGWLLSIGGSLLAIGSLMQVRYDTAFAADPTSSVGRLAAWSGDILDPIGFALITGFLFLLYPSGRTDSRAARSVAAVAIVGLIFSTAGAFVEPSLQEYTNVPSPLAPPTPGWVAWTLIGIAFSLFGIALIASVVLLIRRMRRAAGHERDQLRLLVWTAAVATVLLIPAFFAPPAMNATTRNLFYLLGGIGLLLIPVAVAVAILRHRLWDIDLVIRRTLMVALLGAFITVVYVGIVVGVGTVVGSRASAAVSAIAVAVIAIAFQPVRRWAQRVANRLVYGERATPYEVLHDFSERVAGSYRTEDVLPRMAAILGEGTGAERAQVWLRVGSALRSTAVWPQGADGSAPISALVDEVLALPGVTHAVAVRDEGDLLGALSITKPASDPVSPAEEKLVGDLALQAGLVLRNAQLVEDLRASRQRLVSAQDQERRRIERNVHDGAQQQLVALAVKANLVDSIMDRDAETAHRLVGELQIETQDAIDSLRELARGIYPAVLSDRGLVAALENQAARSPVEARVHSEGVARLPQEIEAAVYFCCLEAMQNAAKYARASRMEITLAPQGRELAFEVRDDGVGFDPASEERGSGLQNMADRLAALDGTLLVESNPGSGTAIVGRIPIPGTTAGAAPG
jgi:signal transduction histidine kinase